MTGTKTDPNELIVREFGGKTFKASRRTFAHLDYTAARLKKVSPKSYIRIIQGCYHDGELSAGTHDFDAVVDVEIVGMDWTAAQWFLRSCGWAAWWRHTGTWLPVSMWHIHMVSIGYTTRVGIYVPGQVLDYYHHTFGLKGQHNTDLDKSQFPGDVGSPPWPVGTPDQWARDINATIFDFALWEQELEDNMGYQDWAPADKAALAQDVANAVAPLVVKSLLQAIVVNQDGTKVVQVLRHLEQVPEMIEGLSKDLGHPQKIATGD